jgi:hypothetical protein
VVYKEDRFKVMHECGQNCNAECFGF